MSACLRVPVQMLGQSGCRLQFPDATVYVDPYLSNSVQLLDAADLERLTPIPIQPKAVTDADIVLVTHDHIDHCDPHTLPALALASPQARFVGPAPVLQKLGEWGIDPGRFVLAEEEWLTLSDGLRVRAVPAAHPDIRRDAAGMLACVGYLLDCTGQRIYLSGDTSAHQDIIDTLKIHGPVNAAFLPVNEHNFFRGRRGIIGNMSVREAFEFGNEIGARQVVAVHWDMFAINSVDPNEIRLIYQRMKPNFSLLIQPSCLNLGQVTASIIIRTLNEARYLDELLQSIAAQQTNGLGYEVLVVDSGSTDDTLKIAERHGCRIQHITRQEFSFGRSLNRGCEEAIGDILVIISGHCVPVDEHWLQRLCQPILDGRAEYVYGRQLGGAESHLSECRIFAKYYPDKSRIPQDDFFCNNANSALLREAWVRHRFDEDLTGLEDMELAQRLVRGGGRVAYVAEAPVYHLHNESWLQVRRRFEREAIALRKIMPQVHVNFSDTLRYVMTSVWKDWCCAHRDNQRTISLIDIVRYRWNQYWGAWKGNQAHRKLSQAEKDHFFFPE